jgi:hypothetical protein
MGKKLQTNEPVIELRPDGWERFEKAVDVATKHQPSKATRGDSASPAEEWATGRKRNTSANTRNRRNLVKN